MAAVQPPAHIQALTESSDVFRRLARAHRASAGVRLPGDLAVSQNGTPNMSVNVAAGEAVVDGTQATTTQGSYEVLNDATVNLAIAAADPTNPRIDIVVAQVEDAQYAGAANDWKLAVVTGTPAPSPSPPAAPANSLILAQVAVAALVTSIVNANITDKRTFVWQTVQPGVTGFHVRDSTNAFDNLSLADNGTVTVRASIIVPPGQNGTPPPTSYGTLPVKIDDQTPSGVAATNAITVPSWATLIVTEWEIGTTSVNVTDVASLQFNADTGANYNALRGVLGGTYSSTGRVTGQSSIVIGSVPGSSTTEFGAGTTKVYFPRDTGKLRRVLSSATRGDSTNEPAPEMTGGTWTNTANAIATIVYLVSAGNFLAGSRLTTWAYP